MPSKKKKWVSKKWKGKSTNERQIGGRELLIAKHKWGNQSCKEGEKKKTEINLKINK